MKRITLAPSTGVAGTAKAVKYPESFEAALALAAEKEVLGSGVKPTRVRAHQP